MYTIFLDTVINQKKNKKVRVVSKNIIRTRKYERILKWRWDVRSGAATRTTI